MASKRQMEANRRNWQLWRGLTPAGRKKLRDACNRNHWWKMSTGARTATGKQRSRANAVRTGEYSITVEPEASANILAKLIRQEGRLTAWLIQRRGKCPAEDPEGFEGQLAAAGRRFERTLRNPGSSAIGVDEPDGPVVVL